MRDAKDNNSPAAFGIVAVIVLVYLKMPIEFFWVFVIALVELFCLGVAWQRLNPVRVREMAVTPKFINDIHQWSVCAKHKTAWRVIPAMTFCVMLLVVIYAPRVLFHQWPQANVFRAEAWDALGLPLPVVSNHHWYVTLGILLVALIPALVILNSASTVLFPHSHKARRLRSAIHGVDDLKKRMVITDKKRGIEQDKFTITQTSPSQAILRYAAPVTVEDFRANKGLLESAAGIDIADMRELRRGEILFVIEMAQVRRDDNQMWVDNGTGGLRTIRKTERCVYFMYDPDWICPNTERRGRIKIGGGKPDDRHDAGETWIIDLQKLGYFVETPDFNEVDLQEKFSYLRINRDKKRAGREWFYDAPEIRELIASRQQQ